MIDSINYAYILYFLLNVIKKIQFCKINGAEIIRTI